MIHTSNARAPPVGVKLPQGATLSAVFPEHNTSAPPVGEKILS